MIFPGFPGVPSFFQVFQVEWEPCFFIIKLKPFMSGEKVEGERVRGSSAEGGTHHRCTSGPKKGGGPIIFGKGSTYLAGGGGRGCLQTIIHQQILFLF